MRKALLLSPWTAAILFTIPQSWELMHRTDSDYIPLAFEVLLLLFSYIAAAIANTIVIVPLCLLVKMKTSNLLAGLVLAFFVALTGTTVAYAFEIFDYRPSILHPDYLFPLLIPLFVMSTCSFFLLTRSQSAPETGVTNDNNEDSQE
jgi:hypothetical protein